MINLATGFWNPKVKEGEQTPPTFREVSLFTTDTADALYLEPMETLGLGPDGVLTLQYALKRAIENTFQVEPSEIGASAMGDAPNLLLYEASEGSLGVLSQFWKRKEVFHQVVTEAQKLCRFDDSTYSSAASYDDLLSYYNQPYHQQLDRFLIKEALETLSNCNVELQQNASFGSYVEQLQAMLRQADPKSQLETKFLNYLGDNGLKLPDAAQKTVPRSIANRTSSMNQTSGSSVMDRYMTMQRCVKRTEPSDLQSENRDIKCLFCLTKTPLNLLFKNDLTSLPRFADESFLLSFHRRNSSLALWSNCVVAIGL